MVLFNALKPDEVIAVSGKLITLSCVELAKYLTPSGLKLVRPGKSAFTILVVADKPSPTDIIKAKSIEATILTERQFLDRLHAADLLEKLKMEACDPATSKKRLCQLAAVVPEAVAQNSLWQVLHLEDPDFLDYEDGLLKLRLLRLLPAELFDELAESTSASTISVDVFASRVVYVETDNISLSHSINVPGLNVTLYCYDCDADMEDVGLGCEDQLPIAYGIKACLLQPFADLRDVADRHGISYEEQMSPSGGSPLRVGGMRLESNGELFQCEWDSFPTAKGLIAQLVKHDDNFYRGVSLNDSGSHMQPLFSSRPVCDEDSSYEGAISIRWACDCFVPTPESADGETTWNKIAIDEEWVFVGSDVYGYKIEYEYNFPIELEEQLVEDIDDNDDVSRKIGSFLLSALGLSSSSQPK